MSQEENKNVENSQHTWHQITSENTDRRSALKTITAGLVAGIGIASTSCSVFSEDQEKEASQLSWDEFFKKNYKIMSDEERIQTVQRLESLYEKKTGNTINISHQGPLDDVLFGYVFNISKCQGYMDCVNACVEENNQDRDSEMKYISIHQIEKGHGFNFEKAEDDFTNEVPLKNHFYIGTQCFHCENPPCVSVCPTEATWKEKDGIVVVDYDWCIGCRYCSASCPYDGRRFNWGQPHVPEAAVNKNQHYLGNRLRKKGVMEKCTFCIQRSRSGQNPACVDACPTGARKFGNLLDPKSEIRWILENKKVFRLKEDLGTEPKFWYYMD
ncbi:MAG: 4Fe-4S dicluster domain-containing protein [Flavobacteriaceae bacterium]|nr:4Fe-4S dicluster domain-containing protein [Flavobacteriaceae bacterium]